MDQIHPDNVNEDHIRIRSIYVSTHTRERDRRERRKQTHRIQKDIEVKR